MCSQRSSRSICWYMFWNYENIYSGFQVYFFLSTLHLGMNIFHLGMNIFYLGLNIFWEAELQPNYYSQKSITESSPDSFFFPKYSAVCPQDHAKYFWSLSFLLSRELSLHKANFCHIKSILMAGRHLSMSDRSSDNISAVLILCTSFLALIPHLIKILASFYTY